MRKSYRAASEVRKHRSKRHVRICKDANIHRAIYALQPGEKATFLEHVDEARRFAIKMNMDWRRGRKYRCAFILTQSQPVVIVERIS